MRVALFTLLLTMSTSAAVKIEKTSYAGWQNCYRVSNGEVELIATADVGPRIIRFGFVGGQNLFKEFTEQLGKTGENQWVARGGHRIWIAPEEVKDTYALDNAPVKVDTAGGVLTLTQPVEPETGLEKQIIVKMSATGSNVEVVHRLRNAGKKPREFAPWALTMMAQGGHGVTGFPPRGTHPEQLAPTNPLVMWSFSNLSDPRWKFTKKYMVLRQDRTNKGQPQKLGHFNPQTWGAYVLGTDVFIKRYRAEPGKRYADFGCSYETFTNQDMLELETLGPLASVAAGASAEHIERWSLHRNVKISSWTDEELDRVLLPLLK